MQWLNLKATSRKVTRTEPRQRLPSLLQQPGRGPSGGTPDFDRNDSRPPTILPQGALSVHCDPSNRADEQQQARTRLDEKPRQAAFHRAAIADEIPSTSADPNQPKRCSNGIVEIECAEPYRYQKR